MLDLTLDLISGESSSSFCSNLDHETSLPSWKNPNPVEEDSGNSNSSSIIINGGEDNNELFPDYITRQFFPVTGGNKNGFVSSMNRGVDHQQWLKLSTPSSLLKPESCSIKREDDVKVLPQKQQIRKSRRGPRSKSSQYRGVTFYRRTGRWESHIWDCGKQVYLGGFDTAQAAARAYDRAAIKFRGVDADINFDLIDYEEELKQMGNLSKEEFVHILRRQCNGMSRGNSRYKGLTLHKCGRWEAKMGQLIGNKVYEMGATKNIGIKIPNIFEPTKGSSENLDLSLAISLPSLDNPSTKKRNAGDMYEFKNAYEITLKKNQSMIESASRGVTMSPMYPTLCSHAFLHINKEDKERDERFGMLNLGSRVQANTNNNDKKEIHSFSNAASSGFSSSSAMASSSNFPYLSQTTKNDSLPYCN